MRIVRVAIEGRVQGVGYRAFVHREALARGLGGWVRNRRDGTVEAVFSGDVASVDAMLAACHDGPLMARVSRISVSRADAAALEPARGADRFAVLATA
jgi:acylphosphatase